MITSIAQFTMRRGKVSGALELIQAVGKHTEAEQPGALLYLVHRVLDEQHRPSRTLLFYEQYRDQAALNEHLQSSAWQAVVREWATYFEGQLPEAITVVPLERVAGFERPGAIPAARSGAPG